MIKLIKEILLLVFVFLNTNFIFSQESLLRQGNEEYEKYEYINARNTYLKVIEKGYRSREVFEKIGNCYYFNSEFEEASKWYKELFMYYKSEVPPEYYFRYAQTLKSIENYYEANYYMYEFVKLKPEDGRAILFLNKLDYLENDENQLDGYSIKNLSMNSSFTDFGTAYYGRYVIFSSSRKTKSSKQNIHEWNKESYLDLYIAEYEMDTGEFVGIGKWNDNFNSNLHESTPIFTKDQQTVYFTRNDQDGGNYETIETGKIRTDKLKIFRSHMTIQGEWSKPEELPFNSDEYSVAHPALSNDEKKLYFSSDMPGGEGESDIYEIHINADGSFGEPTNLGPLINTEGKETFPFISANNNLYFSSDGHVGFGGLDIFVIPSFVKEEQNRILNMGKPVNSNGDDFAFIINDKTRKGYFSSNRNNGKGGDDIYALTDISAWKKLEPKIEKEDVSEIKKGDDLAKKLKLNPIYFDLDKSFIRPDAAIELDKIIDVMNEYPNMKIEIGSHTDSRALMWYNRRLSDRRARSTRMYLIRNGISGERITSKGYGESVLLNHCGNDVKCSEEEHQLNRRSEFIVLNK